MQGADRLNQLLLRCHRMTDRLIAAGLGDFGKVHKVPRGGLAAHGFVRAVIEDHMPADTIYSATTGRATRELFFLREKRGETRARDFLNVGAMGHASSVALGIALEKPERPVVALDGDSAAIMHLGAMTMVSKVDAPNFLHVVLNNGAHESVGGQPSAGHLVDFTRIAEACGYRTVGHAVTSREELIEAIGSLRGCGRAAFIDCRIHKGLSRKLPPIVCDHREAIDALIDELNKMITTERK